MALRIYCSCTICKIVHYSMQYRKYPPEINKTCMPTLCQFQKKIKKPAYNTYGRPGMQTQKKLEVSRPAGNEKTIKQLLGELYGDRQYLEKLLKETGRQHQIAPYIKHIDIKIHNVLTIQAYIGVVYCRFLINCEE